MEAKEYKKPSLTADNVIFNHNHVLVIRRKKWPFEGMWALPGGFVNEGEEPRDAAVRELLEETNVPCLEPQLVNVFGKQGRDPRGWVVSVAYTADVTGKDVKPVAGDDAAETMWIPADTQMQLAFDHNEILSAAIQVRSQRCT